MALYGPSEDQKGQKKMEVMLAEGNTKNIGRKLQSDRYGQLMSSSQRMWLQSTRTLGPNLCFNFLLIKKCMCVVILVAGHIHAEVYIVCGQHSGIDFIFFLYMGSLVCSANASTY